MFGLSKKTKIALNIGGMHCPKCVARVTSILQNAKGVSAVEVDLKTGVAAFNTTDKVDMSAVKAAIEAAGFEVKA